jgi:scyllo-inositol 2-dehydrogenase (NADP+)
VLRVALIGLGKMGLSHFSIINANPRVKVVAICDTAAYLLGALGKYIDAKMYTDYRKMISTEQLDAVIVATPSHIHADAVANLIQHRIHTFCEKPFCVEVADGARLTDAAEAAGVVNQVGYHYRFVASFNELKRLIQAGELGRVHHIRAEAFGPVVLRPTGSTWRSAKSAGGGCLLDYASHAVDLVNYLIGRPDTVKGAVISSIFSKSVEDEVYATLGYQSGVSGQLSVNWSDPSHRKMATSITVWGERGRAYADRQEVRCFRRDGNEEGDAGSWTIRYTTDLTEPVSFYLRGEEYSAQLEEFVSSIIDGKVPRSTFRTALDTDLVVSAIREDATREGTHVQRASGRDAPASAPQRKKKLLPWP